MIREPVARRYARALFNAAKERNALARVSGDLEGIARLMREERRLGALLTAPRLDENEKKDLIRNLFHDVVHPLVEELFYLLLEKKRMKILSQIIEGFTEFLDEDRGVMRAEVITAIPLDEESEAEIRERLEKMTGMRIKIEKRINPAVIGGVAVRLRDRIIDGTVRRRLELMREHLLEMEMSVE